MSPTIAVAVCARPGAPLLDRCLAALDRAGVAAPFVTTSAEGHGPAAARNEALACTDAAVVAYVDDDVLVPPGWLRALRAAWETAPAGVAAIGGPLATAVTDTRPAWLSDELVAALIPTAPALSAAFDPARRTLPGGNLSFRATALRGVGGFWPARGHPAVRDWFTEEHEVQRELGRAGWELRQDAALAARRLVEAGGLSRREVLALRARMGARRAVLGAARPRGSAAVGAARSAVGAALAAARGDGARATARAARAAEHAGALAGAAVVHAELQPVADRTPFRHTVAPPQPHPLRPRLERVRRRRGARPMVIALHRVATPVSDPLGLAVAEDRFAMLLAHVAAERTPAPLQAVVDGEAPGDAVALTLDDGYVDNLTCALPLLEKAGVPATVLVSTGHVAGGRAFWWDELDRVVREATPAAGAPLHVELGGDHREWPARTPAERAVAAAHLFAWLSAHPPEAVDAALDGVAAWARVARGASDTDRPLTVDELRRLAASPLIEIGSHTRTHPSLALVAPERRTEELRRSREDLAGWLGSEPAVLAYPFGVWGVDVDRATRDAAAAAGYRCAVVNGVAVPPEDRWLVPRVPVASAWAALTRRSARRPG